MSDSILDLIWKISWQAAIIAAVVWITARLAKKAPAAWRYGLWVIVLVKFMVPPFAYLPEQVAYLSKPEVIEAPAVSAPLSVAKKTVVHNITPQASVKHAPISTNPVSATSAVPIAPEPAPVSAMELVFAAWLLGVCVMATLLIVRVCRQRRLISLAQVVNEPVNNLLSDCAARLRVKRIPLLLQSDLASTPMLVGLFRPIIILPMGMAETCPEAELRAIFLHELAHVKRWDMAVLWLYHIVGLAFFFNPALWLAGKELKRERELACDELVLASSGITRQDYAAGYVSALKMASATRTPVSLAMAEPFEMEKNRLHSILRLPIRKLSPAWIAALVLVGAVSLPTFIGCAKSANVAVTRYALHSYPGFVLRYKKPFVWKSDKVTIIVTGIGCTDPNTLRKERMLMLVGKIKYSRDYYNFADQTSVDGRKLEFTGWGGEYEWLDWQNAFPMPAVGSKWINEFSGELYCSPKGQTFKRSLSGAELRTPRELYKNKLALLTLDNGITPFPKDYSGPDWAGAKNADSRYVNLSWISVVAPTNPQVLINDDNIHAYDAHGKRVLLRWALSGFTSFDRWQRSNRDYGISPSRNIRQDWQRLVDCTKSYGDAGLYYYNLISDKPISPDFKLQRIEFTIRTSPRGKPVPFSIRDIPIPKEFWEKPKPAAKTSQSVQIAKVTKEYYGFVYNYKHPVMVKGDGWSLSATGIGGNNGLLTGGRQDIRATLDFQVKSGWWSCDEIHFPSSNTSASTWIGSRSPNPPGTRWANSDIYSTLPIPKESTSTSLSAVVSSRKPTVVKKFVYTLDKTKKLMVVEGKRFAVIVAGWDVGLNTQSWKVAPGRSYGLLRRTPRVLGKGNGTYLTVITHSSSWGLDPSVSWDKFTVYDADGKAIEMEYNYGGSPWVGNFDKSYKYHKPPYYGFCVQPNGEVVSIDRNGPAANANIKIGDVVTSSNRDVVTDVYERNAFPMLPTNAIPPAHFTLRRGSHDLKVTIAGVPDPYWEPIYALYTGSNLSTNFTHTEWISSKKISPRFRPVKASFTLTCEGAKIKSYPIKLNIPIPKEFWEKPKP